jgi:menaquinone-dependent protoporphyrinogen oxidase
MGMKKLIVYGTKTGTTENCAMKIKADLGDRDVEMLNLNAGHRPDVSDYEIVIIGTPIYMGRINGKVKSFLLKNHDVLMQKDIHFFVCGLARGDEGVELFRKQIPEDLFNHAVQVRQLGSEIHPERLNPLYRTIIKKIVESEKPPIGLLNAEIDEFAKGIR